MTEHTPAPWQWIQDTAGNESARDVGSIQGANGATVCYFGDAEQFYPTAGYPPSPIDLAVILAAPDLLVALKRLLPLAEYAPGELGSAAEAAEAERQLEHARAAIAKAEGSHAK